MSEGHLRPGQVYGAVRVLVAVAAHLVDQEIVADRHVPARDVIPVLLGIRPPRQRVVPVPPHAHLDDGIEQRLRSAGTCPAGAAGRTRWCPPSRPTVSRGFCHSTWPSRSRLPPRCRTSSAGPALRSRDCRGFRRRPCRPPRPRVSCPCCSRRRRAWRWRSVSDCSYSW